MAESARTTRDQVCLWFGTDAEEAADFYCKVIPRSEVCSIQRMPGNAKVVLSIEMKLNGMIVTLINGQIPIPPNAASSILLSCSTQEEIDHLWAGFLGSAKVGSGDEAVVRSGKEVQSGWVEDPWGFSWQVVPGQIGEWLGGPRALDIMGALHKMKKIDMGVLQEIANSPPTTE